MSYNTNAPCLVCGAPAGQPCRPLCPVPDIQGHIDGHAENGTVTLVSVGDLGGFVG
jgi:hypothetical protein